MDRGKSRSAVVNLLVEVLSLGMGAAGKTSVKGGRKWPGTVVGTKSKGNLEVNHGLLFVYTD